MLKTAFVKLFLLRVSCGMELARSAQLTQLSFILVLMLLPGETVLKIIFQKKW